MKHPLFFRVALIAAGVLAATGAAQAQSSVTLYGALGLDLVSASKVFNGSSTKSMIKLEDNAIVNSRIGLKGSEDLGGGLRAIFNLESSVAPDTGGARGSQFWNRGAYVGLAGDFGQLRLGHQWDAADDLMGNYFIFGYYSSFLLPGFYSLSNYYSNAIKYSTPNIGGFQAVAFYALGERQESSSAGSLFQLAATYDMGPFSIGGMFDTTKDPLGSNDKDNTFALGASYNFGPAKLRLGYSRADVEIGADYKANLIDVGVDVPLGDLAGMSADFIKKDVKSSADDFEYVRLQGYYRLSKRTTLNTNLIFAKNKGNSNFAFVSNLPGFVGEAGQKQTILTAGITHAF